MFKVVSDQIQFKITKEKKVHLMLFHRNVIVNNLYRNIFKIESLIMREKIKILMG